MNAPVIVSAVRDRAMYDACIGSNRHLGKCRLEPVENRERNDRIATCYNRALERHLDDDAWIVFCHEDFQFLEDPVPVLEAADKNAICGPIGGVLAMRPHRIFLEIWEGSFRGTVLESEKDGSGTRSVGVRVPPGTTVDTLDCQCLAVHSSLLRDLALRFDEQLTFDLYAEDFCMAARLSHGIETRIAPFACQHRSRGTIEPRFFVQLAYLVRKYPRCEAFGAVGYSIGGGRTPVRRFQKRARALLDVLCPAAVRLAGKIASVSNRATFREGRTRS